MSNQKNNSEANASEKKTLVADSDGRSGVTTVTTVTTEEHSETAHHNLEAKQTTESKRESSSEKVLLTPEEEKVVRMRYGQSLQEHEALEFAANATMETRLKLALIESSLLKAFEAQAFDPDPQTGAPRSVIADAIE